MDECERCGEAEWEVIVVPYLLCYVCAEEVEQHLEEEWEEED